VYIAGVAILWYVISKIVVFCNFTKDCTCIFFSLSFVRLFFEIFCMVLQIYRLVLAHSSELYFPVVVHLHLCISTKCVCHFFAKGPPTSCSYLPYLCMGLCPIILLAGVVTLNGASASKTEKAV
jgi:hypothetical protein